VLKIYTSKTVYDAAIERIEWLFDEFEHVVIAFSGGKDSTVVFHLALEVARRRNRLPLTVMWIDQEAEWQATVEQQRYVMTHPDVRPRWYQMPFKLFNATSATEHWLNCWDPAEEARWMRPRETYSIHENVYGCDRFHDMFNAIMRVEYDKTPVCVIGGVRCEESPTRLTALTSVATYKWATWGKLLDKKRGHYTMYPIYDWLLTDVWKAIYDHDWPYNAIYDAQYRYGIAPRDMRVSNVHHETAVQHLFYMQEVERETYERLTARIAGVDSAAHLGSSDFFVTSLPPMFSSWIEYRDYLLENLIENETWKAKWRKTFKQHDALYVPELGAEQVCRVHINSILTNDWEQIKIANYVAKPNMHMIRKKAKGQHVYA
jgi:predicted phosphoadenosine phosphosulfate sulfurtransferase